jgi:hypothetical protein
MFHVSSKRVTSACFAVVGLLYAMGASAETMSTTSKVRWVRVPGRWVRNDCLHQIPKEAQVDPETGDVFANGKRIAHYDACPEAAIPVSDAPAASTQTAQPFGPEGVPATGDGGYVELAADKMDLASGRNITASSATLYVPPLPSSYDGQQIGLWNGIQSSNGGALLQPVLQYGVSPAGGGAFWSIVSFALFPNNNYFTGYEIVNPGDEILLQTSATQTGVTLNWTIKATDLTGGAFTSQGVWTTGYQFNFDIGGAMEVYRAISCNDFPGSSGVGLPGLASFFNVSIANNGGQRQGFVGQVCANTPNSCQPQYTGPACGFAVGITSDQTEINLLY